MEPLLTVSKVSMVFGGLRALDSVSLEVNPGEILALIGPNGAGKTTLFNCITGIYRPTAGRIVATPPGGQPRRIDGRSVSEITRAGLARTFQNIRLFPNMTVLENVMVGRHGRTSAGILGAIFRDGRTREEERRIVADSYAILERMGLEHQVNKLAQDLPYGAQRRLEIARALATEPFLLLLDEPAAGMNPQETNELEALISSLRDREGVSILLIEHDMKLVMSLAERIVVLNYGEEIAEGSPRQIRENPEVIQAYLGEATDA